MQPTIIKTADGSHSLYLKELDEHYHSIHGAIQEGKHVFIEAGLKHIASQNISPVHILEIGLGTGLNVFLTFLECKKLNLAVNYTALEAFPLELNLISQLNYVECLNEETFGHSERVSESHPGKIFTSINTCRWETEISLSELFTLHKINNTLQEINFTDTYHLIYFDAFGPRVQPEMWTEELFSKLFSVLKPNGCLVTYCAKGEVKRTLKKIGFVVETLPGPPRKREMVRATKI